MNKSGLVCYELWQEEDGYSFFPTDNDSARKLLAANAQRIWSCQAASWEEAQTLKHRYLGWSEYRPLESESGNPGE